MKFYSTEVNEIPATDSSRPTGQYAAQRLWFTGEEKQPRKK